MKWNVCFLLAGMLGVIAAQAAQEEAGHPYPGIDYRIEVRTNPPMRMFIAEVDLSNPRIHVRTTPGGPDPDGPGRWTTTLMRPTAVAAREHFDLVVNGDFFSGHHVKNAEGAKSKFVPEVWATVAGPAVTDGKVWVEPTKERPCLVVHKDKTVSIEMMIHPKPDDWEVIAGNIMLIKNGKIVVHTKKVRNPRTAVGLDATGKKLIILVIDGRKPGISIGTSDADTAAEMLKLGCREALNLDGGGSSMMAVRNPRTGEMRILNKPSDGRERAVGDVLGISVDPQ